MVKLIYDIIPPRAIRFYQRNSGRIKPARHSPAPARQDSRLPSSCRRQVGQVVQAKSGGLEALAGGLAALLVFLLAAAALLAAPSPVILSIAKNLGDP